MQTLADIGEDALIRRLVAGLTFDAGVIAGPGDDCAVVRAPGAGEVLLLKTDVVVEGVHFTAATPASLIGRKAMARVISDFAAMAATPRYALITLLAPPQTTVKRVVGIYTGLRRLAAEFGVNIVGGETSRAEQLSISVSLSGVARKGAYLGRGGGKPGDKLLVTGRLGGSIRGKHLRFQPRLDEARWLARRFAIHAIMDISDGLGKDLSRLCEASGLGFDVAMESLPRTRGCDVAQAWGDGEDYELLFAVAPKVEQRLLREWRKAFPKLELTCIGQLTGQRQGAKRNGGWDHFQ
ncbi:MAG TPA: thiamine-phosphate kinase [Prosthecobacter sp.]|nr:thiamine-phosphate kinase [Prosthecobacter sp.]